jgi:CheY-like chemotaxis protein
MNPNRIEVLVLDLSGRDNLGNSLRGVLESSPSLCVHFAKETFDDWRTEQYEDNLKRLKDGHDPDCMFLVIPQEALSRKADFIELLGRESSNLPIIVFFETTFLQDTMTLMLGAGMVDFVRGPLTPNKVLPAVWRLVSDRF